MEKAAIKDFIYGGIEEILRNQKYYYHSPVGKDYCQLTEDGEQALVEYLNSFCYLIRQAEEAEIDQRAKDIVLKELKHNVTGKF